MTIEIPDTSSEDCQALRSILGLVGDKWTVLIVVLLGDGPICPGSLWHYQAVAPPSIG
jgi:DNA-binding HxlR family transcriptional regulator